MCCGLPTLEENNEGEVWYTYEVCYLCIWEQDDEGGANGDYTLREAQENFKKYYNMYRVSNPDQYFKVYGEIIRYKKAILPLLYLIEVSHSDEEKLALWGRVDSLKQSLREEREKLPVDPKFYFKKK